MSATGGFFDSESTTNNQFRYSDSRLAAADNASIVDLRASGKNSRITAATAPYSVAGTGNTVTFTDGGAFDLVGRIVGVQSNALGAASVAGLKALSAANDQISDLAETKITDGANLNQKTTIVALIVFGVIGLVAWIFLRR